jgi:hypothetical protein
MILYVLVPVRTRRLQVPVRTYVRPCRVDVADRLTDRRTDRQTDGLTSSGAMPETPVPTHVQQPARGAIMGGDW